MLFGYTVVHTCRPRILWSRTCACGYATFVVRQVPSLPFPSASPLPAIPFLLSGCLGSRHTQINGCHCHKLCSCILNACECLRGTRAVGKGKRRLERERVKVIERETNMGAYACPLPMLCGIYTNYHTNTHTQQCCLLLR